MGCKTGPYCFIIIERRVNTPSVFFYSDTSEHLMSLKCLNSDKPREACQPYFNNYKNCKDFWASVRHERKSKGIEPYLPPPEERAKIKTDFLNSR